ncbi:MAG: signal transduction histidine kinase/CheY-like chemotaxis protein [Bacteriovoracaceae bacterium]|jgi:signal transduction histidine kinase/CheY-like chemotaxis protein
MSNSYEKEFEKIEREGSLHVVHWLIIFLSSTVTIGAWYFTKAQISEKKLIEFQKSSNQVIELITDRMQKYEDALWAGVSTIYVNGGDIDSPKWRTFSSTFEIDKKYPGISGIGVIHNIKPNNIPAYLKRERVLRPDYHIHPAHGRDDFWPITHIEPVKANARAVGLDMAHELNRYTAALKARDTALAQITGPIVLVQDSGKTPGFLFFTPFYKNNQKDNLTERRENITGLVYAPFVFKTLMRGVLSQDKRLISIKISDGTEILFDELNSKNTEFDDSPSYSLQETIPMYGRDWNFEVQTTKTFKKVMQNNQPRLILICGIILDLLLFFIFLFLSRANKKILQFGQEVSLSYKDETKKLEDLNKDLKAEVSARKFAELRTQNTKEANIQFLTKMDFKIKKPLNEILEAIENPNLEKLAPEVSSSVKQSGQDLIEVIKNILDVSKLEAGQVVLNPTPTDFYKLIDSCLDSYIPKFEKKGITFKQSIDDSVPQYLKLDSNKLKEVLLCLVDNAYQFTDIGSIELTVEAQEDPQTNQVELQVSVIDTGVGLDHKSLEYIFSPFVNRNEILGQSSIGSGLSLCLAKKIVELFKGELRTRSILGKGSNFTFSIQCERCNELEFFEQKSKSKKEIEVQDKWDRDVILVEPDPDEQRLTSSILHQLGINSIEIVKDGVELLKRFEAKNFAVALIRDDFETAEKLRKLSGSVISGGPYIIGMCQNINKEDKDKFNLIGGDYLFEMPLDSKQVEDVLNTLKINLKDKAI